jgi:uncharacterized membrane protein YfcA
VIQEERGRPGQFLAVGVLSGLFSGLLGVGGGIVIVPLLVIVAGMSQHRAHATSLAAIVPIAAVGAITFAAEGEVDAGVALLLAAGSLLGAPAGARWMAGMSEGALKTWFGSLVAVVGVVMILR